MPRRILVLAALTLAAVVPVARPAAAAQLPGGHLDATTTSFSWSGKTLLPTNVIGSCLPAALAAVDPLCDHVALDITPQAGQDVELVLTPDVPGDQVSLLVADAAGNQVASAATLNTQERIVLRAPTAGRYDVQMSPDVALGGGAYHGVARFIPATPLDFQPNACDSAAELKAISLPARVPVALPDPIQSADDGRPINLDVFVLLDGVTQAQAESVLAVVAKPYAPLNIIVRPSGFETVSFHGTESPDLNQQAKDHFGGRRPAGSDVVLVLTSKDITALGQAAVAGQADCLGGVAYDDHAFMVAEAYSAIEDTTIGPFHFYRDFAAKTTAHEMGHLLGGQHQFANCVEGISTSITVEPTPCTLMFNAVDFLTLKFSTLNAAIVRGYAWKWARP